MSRGRGRRPGPRPRPHTALLRSQLAGTLRRPGRLALTGLSVLVAAFVVFGTVLAQEITVRTTLDHFSGTPAATSLVATPDGGGHLTGAQVDAARKVAGVAEATARAESQVPLAGVSDRLLQLTADPGRGQLSRVRGTEGAYPRHREGGAGRHEVAVNQLAARHWGIEIGDRLRMLVPRGDDSERTRTVTATVTGVVETRSDRAETAYAPASAVGAMSGLKGPDRLDLRAESGVSAQALSQRLSEALDRHGTPVEITTGSAVRAGEANEAVRRYEDFFRIVAVFLAVAVVAAALVATSTFRVVFAQRLRQLALLRAIGARRGQLVRALAVEGAVVGLAAGTAGVLSALGAGHAVVAAGRLAGQDLSDPGGPVGAGFAVVAGAALVTLGAVLAPAASAGGVSPLQALRSADAPAPGEPGVGRRRLGVGLVLVTAAVALVGAVLARLPEPGDPAYEPSANLAVTVLSGTLAFLALIALGPLLVRPVLAGAGRLLRWLGPVGKLAVGGVGGAPRRAAAVSLVVALGVTLVAGTLVGIASMRSFADGRLAVQAPADFSLNGPEKGLDPALVRGVEKLPQLADADGYRHVEVSVPGAGAGGASATDMDLGELPVSSRISTATGDLRDLGPGRAVLGARLAGDLGVRAGDHVTLGTAGKGGIRVSVAATLPGPGPLNADIVLEPADLDAAGAPPSATGVLANAAEGGQAGRDAAARAIAKAVEARDGTQGDVQDDVQDDVRLRVLAEDRERSDEDISLLATVALGLLGLTVLIAVVGVGTTTGLTVLERTRESGLLRALGLGRSGLRTMIGVEAGLYGVLGGVLGMALGVPYAWLLIRVLNHGAPLHLPYGQLACVFTGLTALTALTGLLPARRAVRASPVDAAQL